MHPVIIDANADVIKNGMTATVDGKEVLVTFDLRSGGTFIKATYDYNADGNVPDERTLFVGTVDSDGNWTLKLYSEFTVGSGEDASTIFNLPIATSPDMDGDYAILNVAVQTVKSGDAADVANRQAFKVTIDDGLAGQDHVLGYEASDHFSSAKVEVQIDDTHLYDGATVMLTVVAGDEATEHVLTWNAETTSFTGADGDDFASEMHYNAETGVISWSESVPGYGKFLNVSATQTLKDTITGEEFTVADSDYTQREILNMLSPESDITMCELGVHGQGNYARNANTAGTGWTLSEDAVVKEGTFAICSPEDAANLGVNFTVSAKGFVTTATDGDIVTLTNESGLKVQGVAVPEGMLTVQFNTTTGTYAVRLSNDIPISEDSGKWDRVTPITFSVKATTADADNSTVLASKSFIVNIGGSNDVPTLSQVDADGYVETAIVYGNVGRVLSSESSQYKSEIADKDQVDYGTTSYYVLKQDATNTRGFNGSKAYAKDAWLTTDGTKKTLIFSDDQLVYNEANLDRWMQTYTDATGSAGTTSEDVRAGGKDNGFLSTPAAKNYAAAVEGDYGTLTVNKSTGQYTYTPKAESVQEAGGVVQETFSLLVVDHKGAFDIKDVTFRVATDDDGNLVVVNGATSNFVDENGNEIVVTVQDADGNTLILGTEHDDVINGTEGDDTIFAGAGDDIVHAGDGNDTVHGGSGKDTLHGDAGDDTLDGESGDDLLFGGEGNDLLFGGVGDDLMDGGSGQDMVHGDAGNDIIAYGSGDEIDGGTGLDVLAGAESVDALLNDVNTVENMEVAVNTLEVNENTSLTDMQAALDGLGIAVTENGVDVDADKLSKDDSSSTDTTTAYTAVECANPGEEGDPAQLAAAVIEQTAGL